MVLSGLHTNWIDGSYKNDRDRELKISENNPLRLDKITDLNAHIDSKGRIAVGYGYDLFANLATLTTDLQNYVTAQSDLNKVYDLVNDYLNNGNPKKYDKKQLVAEINKYFNFGTENKAAELLSKKLDGFETGLDTALGYHMDESRERATLMSLYYNRPALIGETGIDDAIANDDRIKVWYIIRYRCNGDGIQGIANRRYRESDLFGLWSSGGPSETELQNFEAFLNKTDFFDSSISTLQLMRNRETQFTPKTQEANYSDLIHEIINSSAVKNYFVSKYALGNPIDGNVILGTELGNNIIDSSRTLTKSEIKAGYLESTSLNDLILGGDGADKINGGAGNDVIYGGEGKDIIYGGADNDTLIGGANDDTYYVDADGSSDTIEDKEGKNNKLFINNQLISTFYLDEPNNRYQNVTYKNVTAVQIGTELIISYNNNGTITKVTINDDFQWGDLGLNLLPLPTNPTEYTPLTGDLTPIDFDPDTEGIQTQTNEWGNIITDPNQSAYGRADDLNDTTGNDSIVGGAGDDNIHTIRGGSDRIQGGDGNDLISVNTLYTGAREILSNSIIEGGAGSDIILGHYSVSNQLFGDTYGEMSALIVHGEEAEDNGLKGDFISDYYLPEYSQTSSEGYLYGSDGRDILINNTGMGLIVGGGGDDLIYGDFDGVISANSNNTWDYTIEIITDENGNKTYTSGITGIDITFNTAAGAGNDDVIYAGTGNDYVDAGGGDDEVYGGVGDDTIFGEAGYDFIEGGNGDDILIGDNGDLLADSLSGGDYIDGGDGNDYIEGQAGSDDLFGGKGDDTIYGGEGDDYIDAGDGTNTIYGGDGNNEIFAGSGNDYIAGGIEGETSSNYIDAGDGNNTLFGGIGDDVIFAGTGNDKIQGDAGNDYLDGGAGNNTILGGEGDDVIFGGADIDLLQGDAGDDYLEGFEGNDLLMGLDGNDTLFGDEGDDKVQGDAGDDYLDGGADNDYMMGMDGLDTVYGGEGNDSVWGGADNDSIYGETGNDTLVGDAGDDYVNGGSGDDLLVGSDGNDTLIDSTGSDWLEGGLGNDTLIAGDGGDVFFFGLGDGADVIENYNADYQTKFSHVQFGEGITQANLEYVVAGNDLQINIKETSDSITIKNWFDGKYYKPNNLMFFDSSSITAWYIDSVILGKSLNGTDGDDSIEGGSGYDTLSGGTGNDTLTGGAGDDTYKYNSGDGEKTIDDTAIETEGNTLEFGEGITPADLKLTVGSLDILIGNNGDVIHFNNFNPNDAYGTHAVDRFVFADGTALTYSQLIDLGFDITGATGDDQLSGTNVVDRILGLDGDNIYFVDNVGGNNVICLKSAIPFRQKLKHKKHQNALQSFSAEKNMRRLA